MKRIVYMVGIAILAVSCSDFLNIRPEGTTTALSLDHT